MTDNIADLIKIFMRMFPQGVTVATTGKGDLLWGLTISSFTSISLEPPLVMISIDKRSRAHDVFLNSNNFAVNILSCEQEDIAKAFAGGVPAEERFTLYPYRIGPSGAPILVDAPAYLDCVLWKTYVAGDHSILLGKVVDGEVKKMFFPLIYYNRGYTTVAKHLQETVYPLDFW